MKYRADDLSSTPTGARPKGHSLHRDPLPLWAVAIVSVAVLRFGLGGASSADETALGATGSAGDFPGATETFVVARAEPRGARKANGGDVLTPLSLRSDSDSIAASDGAASRGGTSGGVGSQPRESQDADHSSREGRGHSSQRGPDDQPGSQVGGFQGGRRHGLWETRWAGGTLRSQGEYIEGRKSGLWQEFSVVGGLIEEVEFFEGERQGDWRGFADQGQLIGEGTYDGSLREGEWTLYYTSGQVRETGRYERGLREGLWEFYDDLGRPTARSGMYLAGARLN